ncbi:hypothetical protein [Streptomyces tremellae]|uniref:Uncharacterized protein n=1 Tax=Streptomyces tremellae TaxID=1124239 RepID=A0ABP7F021_9ACTN
MRTPAAPAATLFDEPAPTRRAVAPRRGLAPAAARLVAASSPDLADPHRRRRLFLVVACPYCDHQHVHAAGHIGQPRLCIRQSRCVGQPGGAYFFPAVTR